MSAERDPRRLVLDLAAHLGPQAPPPFPADLAWDWITKVLRPRSPRTAMGFMAWAWKSGTRDLEAVKRMCLDVQQNPRIKNRYAYFASTGTARSCREASTAIEHGVAEHEHQKAATQAWLDGLDQPGRART